MDLPLAIDLARFQFAFTVSFHIVFPAFSIGLASYLAVLEGLWLATGRQVYIDTFRYWLKIFAVAFGMGVVSGIVMSYQFGTNWSVFSDKTGPVLGPLMGYEVLSAMTSARPSRRRRSSRRRAAPGARWSAPSVQHPATHHGEPRTDARSDPAWEALISVRNHDLIDLIGTSIRAFMTSPARTEAAMIKTRNKPQAIDAFIAAKAEIDAMLDRLKSLSDDHFGYAPDDINWGHVGTLAHYAELLNRITDAAFKEGEHAE